VIQLRFLISGNSIIFSFKFCLINAFSYLNGRAVYFLSGANVSSL